MAFAPQTRRCGRQTPMKFVDLFAGLGGFHLALRELGHQCVYACEIDDTLRTLYRTNFGMDAAGDITAPG